MSLNINTKFGEIVTSNSINEKVKTLIGKNALIEGFDVELKDNTLSVGPGKCIILGASIEEDSNIEKIDISEYSASNKNLFVLLSYNHKEYDFTYEISDTNELAENKLLIATLELDHNSRYKVIQTEKVATILELNSINKVLNENILSSQFLEYEGKNITSVETYDAKTENISIKGNTLKEDNQILSVGSTGNILKIKSCGKNLFNGTNFTRTRIDSEDGNAVPSGANWISCEDYIQINPSEYYILSGFINCDPTFLFYDNRKNFIVKNNIYGHRGTSPTNACFVRFRFLNNSGIEFENLGNLQLEANTEKTPYEPYKEDIVNIALPIEDGLKGLPGGVFDEITSDGNVLQRVGTVVFDGTEAWKLYVDNGYLVFYLDFDLTTANPDQEVIADKLNSFGFNQNAEGIYCDNKRVYITLAKGKVTGDNLAGFIEHLKQNNLKMLFEIDHTGEVRVENINLHTFDSITHINSVTESALKPTISCNGLSGKSITLKNSERGITKDLKIIGDTVGGRRDENIVLEGIELPVFEGTTHISMNNKIPGHMSMKVPVKNSATLFDITQEVHNARGGEETLELKLIDMENRAAENVAKQYLEVSTNNGHMKVENCFNGLTKDLNIKGRTLQNIFSGNKREHYSNFSVNNVELKEHSIKMIANGTFVQAFHKISNLIKPKTEYTLIINVINNTLSDNGEFRVITNSSPQYTPFTESYRLTGAGVFIKKLITKDDISEALIDFRFEVGSSVKSGDIEFSVMLFEKDLTANPPRNYVDGIKSLGEEDNNRISILSQGKNLFNYKGGLMGENANISTYEIIENGFLFKKSIDTIIMPHKKIKLKPNTYYNISFDLPDKNGYMKILDGGEHNVTFYGEEQTSYFRRLYITNGDVEICLGAHKRTSTLPARVLNIALYETNSTSQLPYESYKEDKKDILIPVSGGAKGLEGSWCDEILANGDYLQRIGIHIENGNSRWTINSEKELTKQFYNLNLAGKVKAGTNVICNRYPIANTGQVDYPCANVIGGLDASPIRIREDKNKTVEQLNAELRENPVIFYYELKEPILHKAEVEQNNNLATFKEITQKTITETSVNLPSAFSHYEPIKNASSNQDLAIKSTSLNICSRMELGGLGASGDILFNYQLEEGTTATPFEPYRDDVKFIDVPENGLKALPTGFNDVINENAVMDKQVEQIIFTGTEEWYEEENNSKYKVFYTQVDKAYGDENFTNSDIVLCDRFPSFGYVKNKENIYTDNKRIYVVIHQSKLPSKNVAGFKAWLLENNTKALFRYDKDEVPRAESNNLHVFEGTTHISMNNKIPGYMSAKVPVKNVALFEMTKEIHNARGGEETLELNLKKIENRAAENVAKQYLEASTSDGHIKVENCYNGLTKDLAIKGRTLQNLALKKLSNTTKDSDGFYTSTIATYDYLTYEAPIVKPNTEYTLIVECTKNTLSTSIRFSSTNYWDYNNTILLEQGETGLKTFKIRTKSSFDGNKPYGMWFGGGSPSTTTGEFKLRYMILESENPPTSYFEGIKSLGEEENKISILSTNRNVIKLDSWQKGSFSSATGELLLWTNHARTDFIKLKTGTWTFKLPIYESPNISESFSLRVGIFDLKGKFIRNLSSQTFTINEDSLVIVACKFNKDGSSMTQTEVNSIKTEVQEGNNIIEVKQDKKDILLPVQNGAKGLPSDVCDEQYANGGYLQRISERKTLSDFNFELVQINTELTGVVLTPRDKNKLPMGSFINNSLIQVSSSTILNSIYQNPANFVAVKSKGYTVEQFKSDYPNFELYYELKEPILHKAESPTDLNFATFKEIAQNTQTIEISKESFEVR